MPIRNACRIGRRPGPPRRFARGGMGDARQGGGWPDDAAARRRGTRSRRGGMVRAFVERTTVLGVRGISGTGSVPAPTNVANPNQDRLAAQGRSDPRIAAPSKWSDHRWIGSSREDEHGRHVRPREGPPVEAWHIHRVGPFRVDRPRRRARAPATLPAPRQEPRLRTCTRRFRTSGVLSGVGTSGWDSPRPTASRRVAATLYRPAR